LSQLPWFARTRSPWSEAAPELLGIHTNMAGIFPVDIDQAASSGAPAPAGLSADEKVAYERVQFVYQKGIALRIPDGAATPDVIQNCGFTRRLAAYFLDHDARRGKSGFSMRKASPSQLP
jgi:hypothetical protein